MGGQKFQYDESGGTFFYFLLSFLALVLVPTTFFYWPRKNKKDPAKTELCRCEGCLKKSVILQQADPYKGVKELLTKLAIIAGWAFLGFLTYKVSQFDYEMANFDPYEILGVSVGSTEKDIKKSYRQLSKILHPDKETGDEKAFMKLTKAYQALTDDEARKNWEKYGNPDGPGAMSFGIALPSWIVEKENSVWVLGLYGLVFMVALPTAVGFWWYRSIKFTSDQVLIKTTELYYYFFHQTPTMMIKRVIMILAASLEFDKRFNAEIVERSSDNEEIPQLIKQLPNLGEKNREKPFSLLYSVKARAIIHAHLHRIPLNEDTLEKDRQLIVKKCPYLIIEQICCVNALIVLAYARKVNRLPTIETVENCMKLLPMIVQALWEFKSPILQLPYIKEEHMKYFISKKRQVKSLQQLAQMKSDDRRAMLRFLSDDEYDIMLSVLGRMPYVDFTIQHEVFDDENPNVVTAAAIVTVTVILKRKNMSTLFEVATTKKDHTTDADGKKENSVASSPPPPPKKPVWVKQRRSAGGKKSKKSVGNKHKHGRNDAKTKADKAEKDEASTGDGDESADETTQNSADDSSDYDENVKDNHSSDDTDSDDDGKKPMRNESDDDLEWERIQKKIQKKEKSLEGRSKISHPVHCPYFPDVKQEYWWTYICDRKSRTLLTAPALVTNLVDYEEVQLRFTAPRWPGMYTFTVCLRSDSYLAMDQQVDLKLDIKEAPPLPTEHPQWNISESEDDANNANEENNNSDSEFASETDIEE